MSIQKVAEWILDANTCFLIGGGCSACAGKPLIDGLTTRVAQDLSTDTQAVLSDLNGTFGRGPTIEDLVNYLLGHRRLLASKRRQEGTPWTVAKIDEAIRAVQRGIIAAIGTKWEGSATHRKFFQRLAGQKSRSTCDIFSLNYDTVVEASLEELKLPCIDGFRGAENAYFDATVYDEPPSSGLSFRLYKLHGSANWVRDVDGSVRRRPWSPFQERECVVVYPAEQKYLQTQYGAYETLLHRFRTRLRETKPNNTLVVLGYSFRDEHINVAIEDSIRDEKSNLTVYALVGPEADSAAQERRFRELANRCNDRFNAAIGQNVFIGAGLEPEEWEGVKSLDLWRFENLVQVLVGEKYEPELAAHSQGN
jgi:hypothetical protein